MSKRLGIVAAVNLVLVVLLLAVVATRPASGQNLQPRHAVCHDLTKTDAQSVGRWMNARLVEGKSGFITVERSICAW